MTEIERLVERAAKDLADLGKVIGRLRTILEEYAVTIDGLAREKEALERALREIARGSFSRNPLTDDSNTIGVMRSFAEAALRGEEER